MKRRTVGVALAVMLTVVGTFVLVAYVNTAEDRALAGERTVDVLVVAKPVDQGTAAGDMQGMVKTERVPAKVRADDAVSDLEALGDRVASADLSPGEQVVTGRFVDASDLNVVGQVAVPDGYFQLTVALSPERSVGGQVRPGTTVGVLSSFDDNSAAAEDGAAAPDGATTEMILHKVLVTRVQTVDGSSNEDDPNQAPSGNLLVTVALESAHDVERVVFTAEHGTLWLAFEPKDAPEDDGPVVTKAVIYS